MGQAYIDVYVDATIPSNLVAQTKSQIPKSQDGKTSPVSFGMILVSNLSYRTLLLPKYQLVIIFKYRIG